MLVKKRFSMVPSIDLTQMIKELVNLIIDTYKLAKIKRTVK